MWPAALTAVGSADFEDSDLGRVDGGHSVPVTGVSDLAACRLPSPCRVNDPAVEFATTDADLIRK
jgi:hypothetical protein